MEKISTLKFESFDPVEAGEKWAITWGADYKVVEIYVDGERLLDIIREIEVPYAHEEGTLNLQAPTGIFLQIGVRARLGFSAVKLKSCSLTLAV